MVCFRRVDGFVANPVLGAAMTALAYLMLVTPAYFVGLAYAGYPIEDGNTTSGALVCLWLVGFLAVSIWQNAVRP